MKKLFTLSLLALMCAGALAQQVALVFTGRDATTNEYVQLFKIEISDLTQGWTETLYYPDTVAVLTIDHTGLAENVADGSFGLSQNNPNPFYGNTNVELNLAEPGALMMEITDVTGRAVETLHTPSLQPCTHQFHISIADAGIYFLTATQNGKTSSVKMVNNGNGAANGIEYVGIVTQSLQAQNRTKGNVNRVFALGDAMTYKGYAIVDGEEIEGETVAQPQILSESITLPVQTTARPCSGVPIVTDFDGNTYNTLLLGGQCWMAENLKTTKYADGTPIAQGTASSFEDAYWYYPNDDASNKATYGLLYNWPAVMGGSSSSTSNPSGVQGICPDGWHVPSDAEWTQLTDYVASQSEYLCNENSSNIAKALASTSGWTTNAGTCVVGNDQTTNNATGFGAVPAGYYYGSYDNVGYNAYYWSATELTSNNAYPRFLGYNIANVTNYNRSKTYGCSVRCVRD